jgi:transposase
MLSRLKRHEIQVLLAAGHTRAEVAEFSGVSTRTVRRVSAEVEVMNVDNHCERQRRGIGRPSVVEPYRDKVKELLAEESDLMSLEVLRRMKLAGYKGGKTAMYELVAGLCPPEVEVLMRFEGLPGEFSQHDFGQVDVRFLDGSVRRIHFFGSRLKYSRWVEVTIVPDETAETLIRTLADHFVAFGGVPLCAVFDRPKTVALKWKRNGEITEWNSTFALATVEIGFTPEVCWPYQARQKGAVESLVKWVKNSFFKQRRFHDFDDLLAQLAEWQHEVNTQRPSKATGVIPAERLAEERPRLRRLRVSPEQEV